MLPATTTRVPEHTAASSNDAIHRATEQSVVQMAAAGAGAMEYRMAELDREWDIERMLQTNFAIVSLVGLTLGALVNRKWFLFTAGAAGFMVQHALQGWCPPAAVFRRAGFRTVAEIERERFALKALRGDFENVAAAPGDQAAAHDVLVAVER